MSKRSSVTFLRAFVGSALGALLLWVSPAVLRAQEPVPLGPEFRVNTYTTGNQEYPKVAADAAGTFVVVWQGYAQGGHSYEVFGQRFDSAGSPQGREFQINTSVPTSELYFGLTAVGADPAGNFVVVWEGKG